VGRWRRLQHELPGRVGLLAGGSTAFANADRHDHRNAATNLDQHGYADAYVYADGYGLADADGHQHADAYGHWDVDAYTPPGDNWADSPRAGVSRSAERIGIHAHLFVGVDWVKFTAPAKRTYILDVSTRNSADRSRCCTTCSATHRGRG
jgi:hypothetical protein